MSLVEHLVPIHFCIGTIPTFATVVIYITFTLLITEWRMHFRHRMNRLDSEANSKAIDGLNLYVASGVTGVPYFRLLRYTVPYLIALIGVWFFVALTPDTALFLLPER